MNKKDAFVSTIKGIIIGILATYKKITIATLVLAFSSYNNIVNGISDTKKYKNEFKYKAIPLIVGIVIGLITSFQAINFITKNYKNHLILLLIGIIIGGIKTIVRKEKLKLNKKNIIISTTIIIIGIILLYLTKNTYYNPTNKIITTLICSILIALSLYIPGISIITSKLNYLSIYKKTRYIIIGIVLILIIIKITAKIIKTILDKNRANTYTILCTLMFLNIIVLITQIEKIKIDFVNIFTLLLSFLWGYIFSKNVEKE